MLISLLILITALFMLFAAGIPLTWLLLRLVKKDPDGSNIWFISMFTGFSLIAIILKTLVAFNIPLKYTSWPLAVVIILALALFIFKKHDAIPKPPKAFVVGFVLVLAISSVGYLAVGASSYMGYNWWDNIFYASQTQFHIDFPLNTVFDSVHNQPWMAYATRYPVLRISRSMLQGFIAVLCGVNAEYTIGFISILSPLLTYCAMNFATSKIEMNEYGKIAACFFAAMVPGLASLHLEAFLGAALIVPFLIVTCALLASTFEKPTIGSSVLCAMVLATATTIYTELTLVFVLLAAIIFVWSVCIGKIEVRKVYVLASIVAGVLLINIQFFNSTYSNFLSSLTQTHGLDSLYPFALSGSGFSFAYLGLASSKYFGLLAVLMALAGLLGMTITFLENKSPVLLSFIALMLSPIMFFYTGEVFVYPFFRLILISSPVVVLGLWLFLERIYNLLRDSSLDAVIFKLPIKRVSLMLLVLCTVGVSSLSLLGTSANIYRTISQKSTRVLTAPSSSVRLLQQKLDATDGKDIFLVSQLSLESWWLMYYARNDNVWLCHESIDDHYVQNSRVDYSYLDYSKMPDPDNVDIVHDPTYYNAVFPETQRSIVDSYMISNSKSSNSVIGPSAGADKSFELVVYSKDVLTGTFEVTIGMNAESKNLSMNMTIDGEQYNDVTDGDVLQVPISIARGFTKVEVNVLSSSDEDIEPAVSLTNWTLNIDH